MTARDEFAVIIAALMAGKIDGPQALAACVAQHERMVDEAARQAAEAWQQGEWASVLLPKPTPPAVPVIAYANRVTDWLRDRGGAR